MAPGNLSLGLTIGGGVNSSFLKTTKTVDKKLGGINTLFKKINGLKLTTKKFDGWKNKLSDINGKLNGVKQNLSDAKGQMLGMVAAGYSLVKVYSSAANVLKAQGEVATLGVSEKGIQSITQAGQEMALQFGQITAPQFIKASYDIKSGISTLSEAGVKDFTRMAGVTAVATKSSVEEMTKLYALGYGIFRQDFGSDVQFGKQFSGAIASSVQAFKTDGSDLSQGLANIGSSAKAMGVSLAEELAIIGIAKEGLNSASEAGTKYRSFLDGAGKAQEKLGLNFTDSTGQMLPMVNILNLIKDKYGSMDLAENTALKEAWGSSEAAGLIASLINKTDKLTSSQHDLEKAMTGGLSKAEEMAKAADRGYGMEKLGHSLSYIGYILGKTLAPAVNLVASGIGSLAKGIAWLDQVFPILVPTIMGVTAGLATLFIIAGTVKLAKLGLTFANLSLSKSYLGVMTKIYSFRQSVLLSRLSMIKASIMSVTWGQVTRSLGRGFMFATGGLFKLIKTTWMMPIAAGKSILSLTAWRKGLGILGGGFRIAGKSVWFFTKALLLNPVGAIVTGIALGGLMIYKYWQPIKTFFGGVFGGFVTGMAPVISSLQPFFSLLSPIGNLLGFVWQQVSHVVSWFGQLFTPVDMAGEKLNKIASIGQTFGSILAGAFKIAFAPLIWGAKAVGWLGEKMGLLDSDLKIATTVTTDEKTAPLGTIKTPKSKATTLASSAMIATQLVASPVAADLMPSFDLPPREVVQQSSAATSAISQTNTIYITVNNPSSDVDIERAITRALRKQERVSLQDEDI